MNKTITSLWVDYLNNVIPSNASKTQKEETQKAFFAGAMAIMALLESIFEENPSEEGVKLAMDNLSMEFDAFLSQFTENTTKH